MSESTNGNVIELRVAALEDDYRELKPLPSEVAVLKVELINLSSKVGDLGEAVKSLRTAVVGAALTVSVSAIGFAITALAVLKP
jgi:phage tail tape-measure protein